MGIGSYICGYKEDDMPTGESKVLTEAQIAMDTACSCFIGKGLAKRADQLIIDIILEGQNGDIDTE